MVGAGNRWGGGKVVEGKPYGMRRRSLMRRGVRRRKRREEGEEEGKRRGSGEVRRLRWPPLPWELRAEVDGQWMV